MTYATYEHHGHRRVGELQGDALVPLADISEIGRHAGTDALEQAERRYHAEVPVGVVRLLPVVPNPTKIICVATNYRDALRQSGADWPTYPTLFTKFATSLIGAHDPIALPPESAGVDFEGELAVVIGRGGRRISESEAEHHILGYSVSNDITMRDYQSKSHQWLQGKAWDASTPLGPYVVPSSQVDASAGIRTTLNGNVVQESDLSQLIFTVPGLVTVISAFTTLHPGDVILTGTPAVTRAAGEPRRFLVEGDHLTVQIDGVGSIRNPLVNEAATVRWKDEERSA